MSAFVLASTAVEVCCRTKFKPVTKYTHKLMYWSRNGLLTLNNTQRTLLYVISLWMAAMAVCCQAASGGLTCLKFSTAPLNTYTSSPKDWYTMTLILANSRESFLLLKSSRPDFDKKLNKILINCLVLPLLASGGITFVYTKVIHPKYYKHLKKGAHQSHLGRQKMGWFLAD